MTVNFIDIDGLLSIESLKINHKLEELYMTGNPCVEFEHYRAFIIGTLPQIKRLDGKMITATERIQAQQDLAETRARLVVAAKDRVRQRGGNPDLVDAEDVPEDAVNSDEEGEDYYGYSPEIRLSDYHRDEKKKKREAEENKQREKDRDPFKTMMEEERANRKLIKEDGTPRLMNDGKVQYTLACKYVCTYFHINTHIYKHLFTHTHMYIQMILPDSLMMAGSDTHFAWCVCVCVCVCTHKYICIFYLQCCTYICIHTYVYIHIHRHTKTHKHIYKQSYYICLYLYLCLHTHMLTQKHTHTHTHSLSLSLSLSHTRIYICAHAHTHICKYVCV